MNDFCSESESFSFFVSIDFMKAYDSCNHEFLLRVFQQYGFPISFVNLIKELFRDAGSSIMINGYKSKKIKLKSGIRQGCPSSRSFFTAQINPLLVFLNDFGRSRVEKYKTLSGKEFLTQVFMDDGNLFTQSISSLINSMHCIERYSFASGLKMNMAKTKGNFSIRKRC